MRPQRQRMTVLTLPVPAPIRRATQERHPPREQVQVPQCPRPAQLHHRHSLHRLSSSRPTAARVAPHRHRHRQRLRSSSLVIRPRAALLRRTPLHPCHITAPTKSLIGPTARWASRLGAHSSRVPLNSDISRPQHDIDRHSARTPVAKGRHPFGHRGRPQRLGSQAISRRQRLHHPSPWLQSPTPFA